MNTSLRLSGGALSVLLLLNSCTTNPVTGKKEVTLVSESQEVAMGQQSDPAVTAQFGLYPDKKLQNFIDDKGQKMAAISHRRNLKYQFKIVDSPVINAFAVPGGYVYFTRGIMAHFNNEAQFAGVLGHEIGHITARHTAQQQTKAIFGQVGLIGAMILSPRVAEFGQQAMQGMQLLFLKFGRDAERQSDELGVAYSSQIGYDASQMADFFQTLSREQQKSGAGAIPDFLSTHPNPEDRYNTVKRLAAEWKQKNASPSTKMVVNRDQYLKLIDGLVYGEDPKQGFVENSMFYHPELKFQFPVPQGWKHQNTPQQFQMADPAGKALLILTTAPGNSVDEATLGINKQLNLQLIDSRRTTINGFPTMVFTADQVQQDQQTGQQVAGVRVLGHVIQDGKTIYALLGVSAPADFPNYTATFTNTAAGFQRLTDADKLNRQPERIKIKTAQLSTTLAQALTQQGVPQARHEEMAILNGMQLTDRLGVGSFYKVVGR
ncbi:M48 family metalloprotease [Hymenobacter saemangeumensis]|uniref:M48 family metalloprotease n=1 Tax=Hymenobacter saemangeumensis TaxID=1084522 RepID=A0ABP8IAT6_9BACT